ncbi:MAG: pitrilysin family protein, partial [Candidatus Hydrogenedentota bacterium]
SAAPDLFSVIGTCEPSRAGLLVNTLFDVVTNPNMADLEIVRESLLDSLRGRADRPFETGLDKLNALRFPGHPYGRPDAGDETGVRAAGVEALRDYLRTLHIRDRLRVVVVGSADTAMIRRAVAERISTWPAGADLPLPIPDAVTSGVVSELAPTAQTIVLRSVAAPPVSDPDYPKWKVANAILGGRSASRLFRIIREERGLAYAVGSFYATRRLGAHLVFYAGCRPPFAAQVRAHYPEALYPPTPAEMDDAIRSLTGDFARDHERVGRRAWYLGWYAAIGLDASYDEKFSDAIRGVTLGDVESVFEKVRTAPVIDLTYGAAPLPETASEP